MTGFLTVAFEGLKRNPSSEVFSTGSHISLAQLPYRSGFAGIVEKLVEMKRPHDYSSPDSDTDELIDVGQEDGFW